VPSSAEDWLPFLMAAADRADEIALHFFRNPGLQVDTKPDLSPVTEADRVIEAMARRLVRDTHPALGVLGEEEGEAAGTAEARLIIDPIDGTRNFVRGIPVFATLLAIETGGEVVAGVASAPALGARWHAARGGGAFRDGRRILVSRIESLEHALLFHGNLGRSGTAARDRRTHRPGRAHPRVWGLPATHARGGGSGRSRDRPRDAAVGHRGAAGDRGRGRRPGNGTRRQALDLRGEPGDVQRSAA